MCILTLWFCFAGYNFFSNQLCVTLCLFLLKKNVTWYKILYPKHLWFPNFPCNGNYIIPMFYSGIYFFLNLSSKQKSWLNSVLDEKKKTNKNENTFLKEQTQETYYLVIWWCDIIILKLERVFFITFFPDTAWKSFVHNDNHAHSNNIKFDKTGAFIYSEIHILKANILHQFQFSIQYYIFIIIIIWIRNVSNFFLKFIYTVL